MPLGQVCGRPDRDVTNQWILATALCNGVGAVLSRRVAAILSDL